MASPSGKGGDYFEMTGTNFKYTNGEHHEALHHTLKEMERHRGLYMKKKHGSPVHQKKSPIRETKHLLTDADSSTDTTVGWTKNTQKTDFFEKRKKSSKTQKLQNV